MPLAWSLATVICALRKTSPGGVSAFKMDKDASYLRCSKLTCYAEFNRMVNAVAKHGTTAGIVNGKDYCFSAALASMLRHVTSNPDEQDQKKELEKVHDWYLANKPLLFSPKTRKPTHVTPTTDHKETLSRPRTAPAHLHDGTKETQDEKDLKDKARPHTTFATNYMKTILGINSEAVVPANRIRSLECEPWCSSAKTPTRAKTSHTRRKPAAMSKVLIPGKGESVTETYRCSNQPTKLSEVYDFASQVADQMKTEKHKLEQCRQTMRDLLVPAATDESLDNGKPPDSIIQSPGKEDNQPNAENVTEGSSIRVSISQDSLVTKSPQCKQPQLTSNDRLHTTSNSSRTTEGLSSINEKSTILEKKKDKKGSQPAEGHHSHVKLQLYEFPDNGKTNSNDELVKHPKPLMPFIAGFNTKRYAINTS